LFDSIGTQDPTDLDIDVLAVDPFERLYSVKGTELWEEAYRLCEKMLRDGGYHSIVDLEHRLKRRYAKLHSAASRTPEWEKPDPVMTDEEYAEAIRRLRELRAQVRALAASDPDLDHEELWDSEA